MSRLEWGLEVPARHAVIAQRRQANAPDMLEAHFLNVNFYLLRSLYLVAGNRDAVIGFVPEMGGPGYVVRRRHRDFSLFGFL